MTVVLTGPEAAPASHGSARQLVVLLHGVGADGADLMALVPYVAPALPDAAFIAPDGPFPYDMAPFGRQWFSLADRSGPALLDGVRQAAEIINPFIDRQLERFGLTDADLALVGFSQGTMTALHVALRRPNPCAALVGFSGALVGGHTLGDEVLSRPQTLLIHGEDDPVVNPASLGQAERVLTAHGVPVLTEMRPGLDHSIDGPGLGLMTAFLRQAFGLETDDANG